MCHNESFFATDQFYASALHVLTAIEIPVHTFGAFIIVARTPKKMSTVKRSMLVLHFVGAFVDLYLSFIATPVLTLPVCAGYPLGFGLVLGIPTAVLVYSGISFVGVMGVSILVFFEDRYHRLANRHGSNGTRNWRRKIYIIFHYILSLVFILPGYQTIPEQTMARIAAQQIIPCLPADVLTRPGFFVLTIDNTIPCLCILFLVVFVVLQIFYFVISISMVLFRTVAKSEVTNRLQRKFFVALCLQVFVPIVVLLGPVLYVALAIWFDYFNQAGTNIALVVMALHGVVSTATMLFVHKPYRDAALLMLRLTSKGTVHDSVLVGRTIGAQSLVL
ncbi:unnamed protein product [Caenorhabditis sp. 36 PRJEB53466]|nr:unnamed protein product [Caenorhabditis sp. 36 PRJEB53466]